MQNGKDRYHNLGKQLLALMRLKNRCLWWLVFSVCTVIFIVPLLVMEVQHHRSDLALHVKHFQKTVKGIAFFLSNNPPLQAIEDEGGGDDLASRSRGFSGAHFVARNIRQIAFISLSGKESVTLYATEKHRSTQTGLSGNAAHFVKGLEAQFGAGWPNRLYYAQEPLVTLHGEGETLALLLAPVPAPGGLAGFVGVDFHLEACSAFSPVYLRHNHFLYGAAATLFLAALLATLVCRANRMVVEEHENGQLRAHLASASVFSAGIIHELKNAIGAVVNYSRLISMNAGKQDKVEFISGKLNKENDRIVNIIDSFLHYCRFDRDSYQQVDLVDILRRVTTLFDNRFRRAGIMLEIEAVRGGRGVNCNPQLIEQVFVNVIDNACLALAESEPGASQEKRLSVGIDIIKMDGTDFVHTSFLDNGPGISSENIKRVGTPFFSTRKLAGNGNGLGLSNSINIVKQHGGDLHVESKEGCYTRVDIYLPLSNQPRAEVQPESEGMLHRENVSL